MKKSVLAIALVFLCLGCAAGIAQEVAVAEKTAGLYEVDKDGKVGLINADGIIVVEPIWDEVHHDPWNKALVFVRKGKLWGLVATDGKVLVKPTYAEMPVASHQPGDPILVKTGKGYGFIDPMGNTVVKPKWKDATLFSAGFAIVNAGSEKSPKYGYIDLTGTVIAQPQFTDALPFSEGLAAVKVKKQYGFIDTTGTIAIEPQFEEVSSFVKGLACVKIGEKYGYIDPRGNLVIDPQFDEAGPFFTDTDYREVKMNGQWGAIDTKGDYQVQPVWNELRVSGPLWRVGKTGKYGAINQDGREVIPVIYDEIKLLTGDGKDYYWVRQGNAWGAYDDKGTLLCETQWEAGKGEPLDFTPKYHEFTMDGSNYIVDIAGNGITLADYSRKAIGNGSVLVKENLFSKESSLLTLEGDLIRTVECSSPVYAGSGLYSIDGARGKFGLMNEQGHMVSFPQWDSAVSFPAEGGLGKVEQGDHHGYINSFGKVVYWSDEKGNPAEYIDWYEGVDTADSYDAPFFLRGIHWGMTADEVVKAIPHIGEPSQVGGFLFYSDVSVLTAQKSSVTYVFDPEKGNLLTSVLVELNPESPTLYEDFSLLRDLLTAQYGQPSLVSKDWKSASYEKKYQSNMDSAIRKGYYSETVTFSAGGGYSHFLSIKLEKRKLLSTLLTFYAGKEDLRAYYEKVGSR